MSSIIFCGDFESRKIDNRFNLNFNVLNNFNDYNDLNDFYKESSPAKPMIASLILPGLGQYLNKAPWWKTALFAGVEVASIAGYFIWTNEANSITDEFENWADQHWDVKRWVKDSAVLLSDVKANGYPEINDIIVNGSHHLTIIVNGSYKSSHILLEDPNIDYIELRDWDFYEGIGKYDQFVAGWDDALSAWQVRRKKITNGEEELIIITPNKQKYINLRNDSNVLYRYAKFAASTLLFNHVISALDALWDSNNKKEQSYKLDVSVGMESSYIINGISINWNL